MATQRESIKWIPGTRFLVDGFRYVNPKCCRYFLTHFHSDHTCGLSRGFTGGFIYCTHVTARLLQHDLGLPQDLLRPLVMNVTVEVDGTLVTPIDANHCPGACMFLFQIKQPGSFSRHVVLHTGDCRWQNRLKETSPLRSVQVDTLFLDTTYCHSRHVFPPQEQAIEMMVAVMRREAACQTKTLFVVGAYHIGKERAFLTAARQLNCRVHCSLRKSRVLQLLDLSKADLERITTDPVAGGGQVVEEGNELEVKEAEEGGDERSRWVTEELDQHDKAPVPAAPFGSIRSAAENMGDQCRVAILVSSLGLRPDRLARHLETGHWDQVVGFRPTGWSYRKTGLQVWREGRAAVYGIPYSEHSSWTDLRECVAALRPKKIIPTVNASDRMKSRLLVDQLADLMDLSQDPSRLDMYFKRSAASPKCMSEMLATPQSCELAGRPLEGTHRLAPMTPTGVEACPCPVPHSRSLGHPTSAAPLFTQIKGDHDIAPDSLGTVGYPRYHQGGPIPGNESSPHKSPSQEVHRTTGDTSTLTSLSPSALPSSTSGFDVALEEVDVVEQQRILEDIQRWRTRMTALEVRKGPRQQMSHSRHKRRRRDVVMNGGKSSSSGTEVVGATSESDGRGLVAQRKKSTKTSQGQQRIASLFGPCGRGRVP